MLITHKNCFDGSVASILYMRYKSGYVEYIKPGDNVHVNSNQEIIFVDIVPKNIEDFDAPQTIVIDHHASNFVALKRLKFAKVIFNEKKCGSELFFEYLGKPALYAPLIQAVHESDLGIDLFNSYGILHHVYGQEYFIKRFVSNFTPLNRHEKELVGCKKREIESLALRTIRKGVIKDDVFIGICSDFESQVARIIMQKTSCNMVALLNFDCGKISLRSCDGSSRFVAEALGGGGHDDAAGFKIQDSYFKVLELLLETIMKERSIYASAIKTETKS